MDNRVLLFILATLFIIYFYVLENTILCRRLIKYLNNNQLTYDEVRDIVGLPDFLVQKVIKEYERDISGSKKNDKNYYRKGETKGKR